jgi:uncharacterized Fe-S cluster protein YjdI
MAKTTHKYTNGEVTIVWKPAACIHSTLCWKGLKNVFNPGKRPWIEPTGGTTTQIIEQVGKCPSGALSYFMNEDGESDKPISTEMAQPLTIEVSPNGPYLIKASCSIQHSDGKIETKTGTTALCRCGSSRNKPFCDGSHREVGFTGS